MGRHAAPRSAPRWFGRGRTRAILSLGVVAALGVTGTSAYWTDEAVVSGGSISSGSMDLQVSADGTTWTAVGIGTPGTAGHITVSNLTPSEAYAYPLRVRNVGDADFTYSATVTRGSSPAWTFVGDPVTVRVYAGSPVTTDTTYPIQQTCGGTALTAAVTVTASSTTVVPSRPVGAGATDAQLCVLVTLASTADNANQGKQGQLRLDFTAQQVTS